jgi:DHA1 family inner membrane transport protein
MRYVPVICEIAIGVALFFAGDNGLSAAVRSLRSHLVVALLPALQNRIVTLAGGVVRSGVRLMRAALNIVNSVGAYAGGAEIAAGLGYASVNLSADGFVAVRSVLAIQAP